MSGGYINVSPPGMQVMYKHMSHGMQVVLDDFYIGFGWTFSFSPEITLTTSLCNAAVHMYTVFSANHTELSKTATFSLHWYADLSRMLPTLI